MRNEQGKRVTVKALFSTVNFLWAQQMPQETTGDPNIKKMQDNVLSKS